MSESNQTGGGGLFDFELPFQLPSVGTEISTLPVFPVVLVLFLLGLAAVSFFLSRRYSTNQRAEDTRQPDRQRRADRPGAGTDTGGSDTGREDGTGRSDSSPGGNAGDSEASDSTD
jgi:hypothetical protein